MEKHKLPEGWEWGNLGDPEIINIMQPGFACGKKNVAGGVLHLRMNNISTSGFLDMSLIRKIPKEKASKANRWLDKGDVLFCNTNSTDLVGKSCLFSGWEELCTFSNHLTRLKANKNKLIPGWLLISLRHLWLIRYFAINCTEFIGQSAFKLEKLRKVEIPVPPLPEQRRIVAKIEELTSRAEQARKLNQKALEEAESFLPSAVAKVFEEGISKGWERYPLSKYVATLESGSRPRGGVSKYTSGIPSISAEQISENGEFRWDTIRYVPIDFYRKNRKGKIQLGDILIVKDGATTGKSAFIDSAFPYEDAMVNEHTFILRTREGLIPKFAYYFLISPIGKHYFYAPRERGVIGSLSHSFPRELEISVPPLPEQRRMVKFLNGLQAKTDELKHLQTEAEAELATFTPALLAKAFKGEL